MTEDHNVASLNKAVIIRLSVELLKHFYKLISMLIRSEVNEFGFCFVDLYFFSSCLNSLRSCFQCVNVETKAECSHALSRGMDSPSIILAFEVIFMNCKADCFCFLST